MSMPFFHTQRGVPYIRAVFRASLETHYRRPPESMGKGSSQRPGERRSASATLLRTARPWQPLPDKKVAVCATTCGRGAAGGDISLAVDPVCV